MEGDAVRLLEAFGEHLRRACPRVPRVPEDEDAAAVALGQEGIAIGGDADGARLLQAAGDQVDAEPGGRLGHRLASRHDLGAILGGRVLQLRVLRGRGHVRDGEPALDTRRIRAPAPQGGLSGERFRGLGGGGAGKSGQHDGSKAGIGHQEAPSLPVSPRIP
jgi:hypothetical protein